MRIKMNNLEYRNFSIEETIIDDKNTVRGLAIPVESRSQLLGGCFYETILRSAVNDELISNNDIKLYVNHDSTQGTFGRSKRGKGTLKLFVTERGLEFECELPKTTKGEELRVGIERGDYDALSFGFMVGKDNWTENNDGTYNRSVESISLLDEISILSMAPAYEATNVNIRSLDDFKQEQEAIKQKESEERNKEYDKMIEEIDKLNIDIDFK